MERCVSFTSGQVPPRAVKTGEERHSTHQESCSARPELGTSEPGSPVTWKKTVTAVPQHCKACFILLRDVSVDELHLGIAHRGNEVTSAQMQNRTSSSAREEGAVCSIARCD